MMRGLVFSSSDLYDSNHLNLPQAEDFVSVQQQRELCEFLLGCNLFDGFRKQTVKFGGCKRLKDDELCNEENLTVEQIQKSFGQIVVTLEMIP